MGCEGKLHLNERMAGASALAYQEASMEAINLGQRLFVDQSGDAWPVVAMFDNNGDGCGPECAVSAVAGTEGRWYAIDLSEFNAGHFQ